MEGNQAARWLIGAAVLAAMALPATIRAQEATPVGGEQAPGAMTAAPAGWETVASGLDNPRGLTFGPDGALYVAEAGGMGDGPCIMGPEGAPECYGMTSAITVIRDGQVSRLVEGIRSRAHEDGSRATGVHDLAFGEDGELYGVIGLGNPPENRAEVEQEGETQLGRLVRIDTETGELTAVADIAAFEQSANPDEGAPDSNPYSLAPLAGGDFVVADAGGNFVARVTPAGEISTLAVFPSRPMQGPDGSEIPMQSVPDAVAIGPGGEITVGELTGFPFPPGGAQVWVVGDDGSQSVFADGFTNIIDLAWAPDGSLYVLEWARVGLMGIDPADPSTMEGRLVRIAPDGTRADVASSGLVFPGGVAIAPDGSLYVTTFSVMEDMGAVVRIPAPSDAPLATPVG
jgi:hypothetical protein